MPTFKTQKVARKGSGTANAPLAAQQHQPSKKSTFKRFLLFLLLMLLVVLMSVGATLYFTWPASASLLRLEALVKTEDSTVVAPARIEDTPVATPKPTPIPSEAPLFVALDPFTVTIHDGVRSRALHVAITTQVHDKASVEMLEEYAPVVRDRVLRVLSEQNPIVLQTKEGRAQLVESLIHVLNEPFDRTTGSKAFIRNVLFTAFVIQ